MKSAGRVLTVASVAVLGLLTSCVELDSRITFRTAESGTVAFEYRIDSRVLEVGMFDHGASILPLPVGRRDFERTAASVEGLELRSFRMRERDGITTINAELSFASAQALAALFGPETPALVESSGGVTRFRHRLFGGFPDGVGESGTRLTESFFAGASVSVTVTAPSTVTVHEEGERDAGGRSVTARFTAVDLLARSEPVWIDLSW